MSALSSEAARGFDLQPAHTLARLHHAWAANTADPSARMQHADRAGRLYDRLAALAPGNPVYWNDWASLALDVLQDPRLARERLERSQALDPARQDTARLIEEATRRAMPTP